KADQTTAPARYSYGNEHRSNPRRLQLLKPSAQGEGKGFDGNLRGKERFPHKIAATAEAHLGPDAKVASGSNEHHRRFPVGIGFSNPAASSETIHAGHLHVEEDNVESLF